MPRLGVIIASVREGRAGEPIANWFVDIARAHGGFEVEVVDLKAIDLPMLSERNHPRLQKYEQPKTIAWSKTVAALDAFAIVTPEYNFGMPPALVNALDHLYHEWSYKAAGFVSYGGVSGGLRSVQMAKSLLTTFKIVPMVEAVAIPFVAKAVVDGTFTPTEQHDKAARVMLDELVRWDAALRSLRT
jgi:NAD(P)H-dependent FMN reductase